MLDVIYLRIKTEIGTRMISEARKSSEDPDDRCDVIRDEMAGEYVRRKVVGVKNQKRSLKLTDFLNSRRFDRFMVKWQEMASSHQMR